MHVKFGTQFLEGFKKKIFEFWCEIQVKYSLLDFGIIWIKIQMKLWNGKLTRFLLFLLKPSKISEQRFQGGSSQAA